MKRLYLVVLIPALVVSACSKKEPADKNQFSTLAYSQTFCADPWGMHLIQTVPPLPV